MQHGPHEPRHCEPLLLGLFVYLLQIRPRLPGAHNFDSLPFFSGNGFVSYHSLTVEFSGLSVIVIIFENNGTMEWDILLNSWAVLGKLGNFIKSWELKTTCVCSRRVTYQRNLISGLCSVV